MAPNADSDASENMCNSTAVDVMTLTLKHLGIRSGFEIEKAVPSRTRYLLDILKTKSYLLETYLIDNYLVTYCHLLLISFLNI